MNTKSKITVALTTCLLMVPAVMAGSWFAGCKLRTAQRWDGNVAVRGDVDIPENVICVVPSDYYNKDYPGDRVPACTGLLITAGFCDPETWSWAGCNKDEYKGWADVRRMKGDCVQALQPDGSKKKFSIYCQNIVNTVYEKK